MPLDIGTRAGKVVELTTQRRGNDTEDSAFEGTRPRHRIPSWLAGLTEHCSNIDTVEPFPFSAIQLFAISREMSLGAKSVAHRLTKICSMSPLCWALALWYSAPFPSRNSLHLRSSPVTGGMAEASVRFTKTRYDIERDGMAKSSRVQMSLPVAATPSSIRGVQTVKRYAGCTQLGLPRR